MTLYTFSKVSEERLLGVHPDLERVVRKALAIINGFEFGVACGRRTLKDQEYLVSIGKSKTLNSRHLTGHAVDLCPVTGGVWNWNDAGRFEKLAEWVMKAAGMENVKLEWGGSWDHFKDYPHYQLPWKDYPIRNENG